MSQPRWQRRAQAESPVDREVPEGATRRLVGAASRAGVGRRRLRERPPAHERLPGVGGGGGSASEAALAEFGVRGEHEVVGGPAEGDAVRAPADLPLAGASVEAREEPWVGGQGHLA